MLNIAIVEDEPAHAEVLRGFLQRYAAERGEEVAAEVFPSGLDFVSDYQPRYDAVFMDIEMPHMNGMDCAFKLRERDAEVPLVFVTGMAQYAVKGYEAGAIGYMLKPVEYFPFAVLMDKIKEKAELSGKKRLSIGSGDRVRRISLQDLWYVEVLDHYLIYHLAGGETWQCLGKMKELEDALAGEGFFRCSNCYLVNLRHVKGIDGSEAAVGGDTIQISRRRKKEFLLALNAYLQRGGV